MCTYTACPPPPPSTDRMTGKALMEYLTSEENNILDMDHLNQSQDMSQPICQYYINSSHNTYLTGQSVQSMRRRLIVRS